MLMKIRTCLILLFGALTFPGCGGLDQVWEGPRAERFLPTSLAVLPPIVGDLDGAREPAHQVVITALRKDKVYDQILGAEQVNTILREDQDAVGALVNYYNKLETDGKSDREEAGRLGQILRVDAFLVVKVDDWEYVRAEGDNLAKVTFTFRLVDTASGSTIWRAKHHTVKSYWFFKPKLRDLAEKLAERMVAHLPQ